MHVNGRKSLIVTIAEGSFKISGLLCQQGHLQSQNLIMTVRLKEIPNQ